MEEKERYLARRDYEREKDRRRRVTPPVSSTFIALALPHLLPFRPPPPPSSLSLCLVPCFSTHPLADYACLPSSLVISFSPSIRYPYHRTTPGVDASRVVATGSERSNLPGILRLCFTSFFIQPACLYFSFPAPLPFFFILLLLLSHFFPLYASFFLSCGRSTCLHAQSTHASASIRD